MKTAVKISINQFCKLYEVPNTFVTSLIEYKLIDPIEDGSELYIVENQLQHVERYMRLHYDLNINFEGLDVINNLLLKINKLEQELNKLK